MPTAPQNVVPLRPPQRQRVITARPGGPDGASIDTWDTLAARASILADANITARDLVDANAGAGTGPDAINAWLQGIGGVLSSDGVNYILPAGYQVKLPPNATVPSESDAAAVADALAAPVPAPDGSGLGVLIVGGVVLGAMLLYAGKSEKKRHRRGYGGAPARRRKRRRGA